MILFIEQIKDFFNEMFVSSSEQADEINRLFIDYSILSAVILGIVAIMVFGGVLLYRSGKRKNEPSQVHGNRTLEIVWTIIPLIIVSVLFISSLKVMKELNEPVVEGQKPDIDIIAHQWWWDIRYPEDKVITANELHIPVGEKLLMRITSADVIHSWWVPALGRKTDAVPGRVNYGWIESDTVGVYQGSCSEYCGTEHAWMLIKVIAQKQEDFNKWIRQQQQQALTPQDSLAIIGKKIFQSRTCGNCHAIAGTPDNAHIGPDLSHLASRKTLLSGMLKNNEKNIRKWLHDPQKIKKGANMPNFIMSKQEINALTEYLSDLK